MLHRGSAQRAFSTTAVLLRKNAEAATQVITPINSNISSDIHNPVTNTNQKYNDNSNNHRHRQQNSNRNNFPNRYHQNRSYHNYPSNKNTNHRAATFFAIPNQNSTEAPAIANNYPQVRSFTSSAPNNARNNIEEPPMTFVNVSDMPSSSTTTDTTLQVNDSYVPFDPYVPDHRPDMYVDTEEKLASLISILQNAECLALDLEFTSFPLYKPSLQFIQVSTIDTVIAIVDCQPLQGSLSPLMSLINSKEVILHGGATDLQVLNDLEEEYEFPCLPAQLFDTQVAAAFIGMGDNGSISLGNLLDEALDVHLEKGLGNSDWSRRPISSEQLAYALDDVRYLHHLKSYLLHKMATMESIPSSIIATEDKNILMLKREHLFRSEMEMIRLQKHEMPSPDEAWLQIRARPGQLTPKSSVILKALAKWRELQAARMNRSPKFLVKDEVLVSLSLRPPKSQEDLLALGYSGSYLATHSETVLGLFKAIEQGDTCTIPTERLVKTHLDRGEEALRQFMLSTASAISHIVSLSTDLIVPFADLKLFLLAKTEEEEDNTSIMRGFRRDLIGMPLRKLKRGQPITLQWNPVERRIML